MIIYKLTNTINGKVYIGQTIKTLEKRWYGHCRIKAMDTKLSFAIKKYGPDVWNKEIIEEVEKRELLNEREIYWIAHYNSYYDGYNSTLGGTRYVPVTEETKQKLREKAKGRVYSEETRKKIGDGHRGKIVSEEARQKMSEGQKKRAPFPEEHRQKLSEANKRRVYGPIPEHQRQAMIGRVISEEARANMSAAQKKRVRPPMSEETKRKISEKHKGKKRGSLPLEVREKLSESLKAFHSNK